MNLLYNLGIGTYALAAKIAATSSHKVDDMLRGQKMAFAHIADTMTARSINAFDFWFHAASLGEFEQARPLIEQIRNDNPDASILLTFFSPSGYKVRHDYPLVDCVAYLPFDTPANARRFVETARPRVAVFIKYEFWGNYLATLRAHCIPTYLVSAIFRPSQIFFRPWGGTFRNMLRCYTHIYIQDNDSRNLLHNISVNNTTVAGDTRFDRVARIAETAPDIPALQNWIKPDDFVIVVGSSWQPDEDRYIPYINNNPQVKTIIAPHQFDDKRLTSLRQRLTQKTILYSQIKNDGIISDDIRTIIIDNFGMLASLYKYATVALIGGGFGAGIHNINEAAAHGAPTIFGPNYHKFKEAKDLLSASPAPGANTYRTARQLETILNKYRTDRQLLKAARKTAGQYIATNKGATTRILPHLLPGT